MRVCVWNHTIIYIYGCRHHRNVSFLNHTVTTWRMPQIEINSLYNNILARQRSSPGCSTKAIPEWEADPTYLIGRSSFLTEIPGAEGGQRMLLAYKLCTRASSEECSNIGALEKSTWCTGHFLLFLFRPCVSLPFSYLPPTLSSRFSAAPTPFADWRGWNNPLWQLIVH